MNTKYENYIRRKWDALELYEDLKWRGLINQISSEKLIKKLNEESLTFYIGTDPTADSLHLGHYSSFLITKRLAMHGHKPIMLIGGATALVGDPRGSTERDLADKNRVFQSFNKLKEQLKKLFPYEIVNNYDWTKDLKMEDFLIEYGKLITTSYMTNKELVKKQLTSGISFAEFSYMLLQGMDFYHLLKEKNVTLQVAGSDQWGNITTGIEIVRKKTGKEVYGLTMPLITDENGKKFGKSEGNAIWLNPDKTSPQELYNFLYNISDCIVISLLKKLTFLSKEEIELIEKEHKPNSHYAQNILGKQIVYDIHNIKI